MSPSLHVYLNFMHLLFPVEVQFTWSLPATGKGLMLDLHIFLPDADFLHVPL